MIKTIITDGQYSDPREFDSKKTLCKICGEKEVEFNDDYCEDHEDCFYCGEREDCDCHKRSDCCGALFIEETNRCSDCKENSTNHYIKE